MASAAQFFAQFFPLFLLGALFGKLMDDSGSVAAIANFMTERLGTGRAILAVVLAGALVTYGGVSVFVAFFVLAPMAQAMFQAADIPRRLMPAAVGLGTLTFTMSAFPGTPAIQNAIPMPFFGTTPFAAPGLGIIASVIMLGFGLWWLGRAEARARVAGEGFGTRTPDQHRSHRRRSDHSRTSHRRPRIRPSRNTSRSSSEARPQIGVALLPLAVVICVNLAMSLFILPRLDFSFLAEERWGATTLSGVMGVWSVVVALAAAILTPDRHQPKAFTVIARNHGCGRQRIRACRCSRLRASWVSARSLRSLPAFAIVREAVLSIGGGPLVSLAVATNVLAALTGSASGGMTIALDALGATYMSLAAERGIDPALLHRVAVIASGTLDTLPHNGAIVTCWPCAGRRIARAISTLSWSRSSER